MGHRRYWTRRVLPSFSCGKWKENNQLRTGSFVRNRIPYKVVRRGLCHTFLKEHVLTVRKKMLNQRLFSKELWQVFARLSNYHIKIMLREFNPKLRINILKVTTGNLCVHESTKTMVFRSNKFCPIENSVNRELFQQPNIHKYTWTTPNGKTHSHKLQEFNAEFRNTLW